MVPQATEKQDYVNELNVSCSHIDTENTQAYVHARAYRYIYREDIRALCNERLQQIIFRLQSLALLMHLV